MPSKRRRARGDGSLFQRKDGLWIGVIDGGRDYNDKRIRRTVSSKDMRTAQAKMRALRRQMDEAGGVVAGRTPTLAEWLAKWLTQVPVKPNTLAGYHSTVNQYIVPSIGRTRVDRVNADRVRALQQHVYAKGLSPHTAHRAHRVLSKALNDALREGLIPRNHAAITPAPNLGKKTRGSLALDEAVQVLTANRDDPMVARLAAALLGGMRQGEALGLQWDRVDLVNGQVDLAWQLQRIPFRHGCGGKCGLKRAGSCPKRELAVAPDFEHHVLDGALCLTRPKTDAGTRLVPLPLPLLTALREHRDRFPDDGPHGLVFTKGGAPIDPSDDNKAWHRALDHAGVRSMPLHAARHTTATLLLSFKVDREIIRAVLGHSSVIATSAYLHVDLEQARAAMQLLGQPFAFISPPDPAAG